MVGDEPVLYTRPKFRDPVKVEFDAPNGRTCRTFGDYYKARQFFATKLNAGLNPKVVATKEPTMSEQNATTPVTPVEPKAKKTPVKKPTTKPVKKEKPAKEDRGLTKTQVKILKVLSKNGNGLTGVEISAKTEVDQTRIGNVVGYRDPEINLRPVHAKNLINRGYVKILDIEDRGFVYTITANGRKAADKAS